MRLPQVHPGGPAAGAPESQLALTGTGLGSLLSCFQIQSTGQCAIKLADTQHCWLEESPEQWPGLDTPDGDAEGATSCPQEAC